MAVVLNVIIFSHQIVMLIVIIFCSPLKEIPRMTFLSDLDGFVLKGLLQSSVIIMQSPLYGLTYKVINYGLTY